MASALVPAGPLEPIASAPPQKVQPNTVELQPHQAEVLSVEFSPSGRTIATASADKTIQLISVYGEQERLLTLKGHKRAVLEAHWSADGDRLMSCSADHDAAIWDLGTGQRIKRLTGHEDIVNSCAVGKELPNMLVTASDDGNTKLWDLRVMRAVASFPERYQVLTVALDDTMYRVFSGSLDSKIRVFDVRKATTSPPLSEARPEPEPESPSLLLTLTGHVNAITGIALSSTNNVLVSNAMDHAVRVWDVRPFCPSGDDQRCFAHVRGATHNFEQTLHRVRWAPDDLCIGVGSADRCAYVYHIEGVESGTESAKLLYKLPGHTGAVTEVRHAFCSCSARFSFL